ncbi:4-(cytidine 5'-diphospho)-2-C-methyl-D-erythritol kinase [Niabella ginsenosidivorans]|uniref:4-diphosphocytidyl-2-C-methyl-D-erythritol kinase n=1 Tax=Niabella ginsenosidivorans TaxID=1176587 RepID=A0A1A9I3Y0_9BACT|nr:4-(cytidine 5'-diphospho)-2-C-methyl-D-erythritol kinase [Niabella ginsenosidivorans]ANH81391.1 4-(cytidine 5'-diphospho)-2-C-methyl-D-erythritol kinase [Niabella ginsenosidivorans]
MIFFSNCKVNIGLHVTGKRPDGFHNLETIFYPLPVYDVLELLPAATTHLHLYGLPIPGNKENNIILKAYQLLKKDFPALPAVQLHLLKNIPAGAGLGAGSANGATALLALNAFCGLELSQKQLLKYALALGSDCPFFIINQPCYATGRGEELTPVTLDLKNYTLVAVNPGIHISTPWAFSHLTPPFPVQSLKLIEQLPVDQWGKNITNDFETIIFAEYPEIKVIKEQLLGKGAVFALMTGTGSTVYGLFENIPQQLDFPENYFVKTVPLQPDLK